MSLSIVLWMGAVVLLITLAVVVQLVVVRLMTSAKLRRQREFEQVWLPVLAGDDDNRPVPPLAAGDAVLFIGLWTRLQELVIGHSKDRLTAVGRRVGIDRLARAMLDRGGLRERLLAVCALGEIR